MLVVIAIPYKTFKERLRIVKTYDKANAKIEIHESFVYIEIFEE